MKLHYLVLLALPLMAFGQTATTTNLLDQLKRESEAATDPELKSLSNDFSTKAAQLSKSLGTNTDAQKQLDSALTAVLGNKGPAAVEGLQKLTSAKLTPEQTKLSKEVYNLGGAYLVKKNFGTLEGSQTEVSQVVSSLRKGTPAQALPPLKKIGQNATLTQPQKDLLSSMVNNYAPGLKRAGDSLKSIPGLKN